MYLEVIYEDDELIAINKPHGLLVHRSKIAADAKVFALQLLRDQIGQKVYPAHRLDRKTSGVLLFSKTKVTDSFVQKQFMNHEVQKTYLAIVRGYLHSPGVINYPIGEDNSKKKEAITKYKIVENYEIPVPLGKHLTSRYSLLKIQPTTGRFHQIRKHMSHIFHPIIGDRPHGCSKQNRMWKHEFSMESMMLHASSLVITQRNGKLAKINARRSPEFERTLGILQSKSQKWT